MSLLQPLLNHKVRVITADGRCLQGTLTAFDKQTNIALTDTFERIFSGLPRQGQEHHASNDTRSITLGEAEFDRPVKRARIEDGADLQDYDHQRPAGQDTSEEEPCVIEPVGVYLVRGENVACIGEVDVDADSAISWQTTYGATLHQTKESFA
ncbi:U4/U6-U5 snRNP complex subunit lsm8 [Savitreella phatthalungensis]